MVAALGATSETKGLGAEADLGELFTLVDEGVFRASRADTKSCARALVAPDLGWSLAVTPWGSPLHTVECR